MTETIARSFYDAGGTATKKRTGFFCAFVFFVFSKAAQRSPPIRITKLDYTPKNRQPSPV
jgi:hypothetical protein